LEDMEDKQGESSRCGEEGMIFKKGSYNRKL
jgi:hypothetical protein